MFMDFPPVSLPGQDFTSTYTSEVEKMQTENEKVRVGNTKPLANRVQPVIYPRSPMISIAGTAQN
jgi:hypothetical protein